MKIAETFDDIEGGKIIASSTQDPYIQAFAQHMMDLSNELNGAEDDPYIDAESIREMFLPGIREFIANVTGL